MPLPRGDGYLELVSKVVGRSEVSPDHERDF